MLLYYISNVAHLFEVQPCADQGPSSRSSSFDSTRLSNQTRRSARQINSRRRASLSWETVFHKQLDPCMINHHPRCGRQEEPQPGKPPGPRQPKFQHRYELVLLGGARHIKLVCQHHAMLSCWPVSLYAESRNSVQAGVRPNRPWPDLSPDFSQMRRHMKPPNHSTDSTCTQRCTRRQRRQVDS